jgi:hypothetical protein
VWWPWGVQACSGLDSIYKNTLIRGGAQADRYRV